MKSKLFNLLFLVFLAFGSVVNASAQLLLKENFEYTAGTALELQPTWDWMNAQGTSPILIESDAYTYTNYPAGTGNKVAAGATGEDLYRTFPKQTTGFVYYSFLVQVTAATTGGEYFIGFSTNPIDNKQIYHGRIYVKKDASDKLAFGVTRVASAKIGYTGLDYDMNTTYLIVLKYEIVTNGLNDVCSMTVNPVIANGESGATWLTTTTTDTSAEAAGLIGAIALRQAAPAVKVSGLRVATTWDALMDAAATVQQGLELSTDDGVKTGFIATTSAPSAPQTFTIGGSGLTADIVISQASSGSVKYFELSTDGTVYSDANVTLTQTGGSVTPTTVYIRMKSQSSEVTNKSNLFTISSTDKNSTYLKATGDVTVATAIIDVNKNIKIYSSNGSLKVSGVEAGKTLEVYNSVGQRLTSMITVAGENNIKVNSKGILIVKVGKLANKVVM